MLGKPWPEKIWLFVGEYLIVYIMVANLTHKEIGMGLAGKRIRKGIYVLTGYLKGVSLYNSLIYAAQAHFPNHFKGFLFNLSLGLSKLAGSALVYYIDNLVFSNELFDKGALNRIYKRLLYSIIIVCILIEVYELEPEKSEFFLYQPSSSKACLVSTFYMIVWYLHEAHEYKLNLREN